MFDLMRLPAELRIKIYEFALVRDVIRIVTTVYPFEALHPKYYESVESWYEDRNPNKTSRLRSTTEIEMDTAQYIAGREVRDQILESYGIQPSNSPPLVNIFLLNRKVYSEAWPIFYEQNAFAFAIPTRTFQSIENCLRFLYDRPHHALRHIRELHLLVGDAPQHAIRFELASGPWQWLLEEMSRYLSIRVLVLYIRGRTDDVPSYPLADLPWRDWLFEMNGLQRLDIDIKGMSTHEENVALAEQMRSKMVMGGEKMGTEGFMTGRRPLKYYEWTAHEHVNTLSTSAGVPDLEDSY
ncbi:hypothetical protein IMSHALPRED_010278 [Imshaugia aleurites]|uniref:Uncharacterized protein n=1 Tax=Imshaugia aleurites TaxID=172621 RepID=A0A8H3G086_9LECA|nr:hypothetical protein IMSHALPRED_010278 [Imshaugia aleurites]